MHGEAHGVEPPRLQRVDVRLLDVVVQPGVVPSVGVFDPNEVFNHGADLVLRPGKPAGLHHVALLHHPAAQAHSPEQHRLASLIHNVLAINTQKMLGTDRP